MCLAREPDDISITSKRLYDRMVASSIVVPDLDEVRAFAAKLHAEGKAWKGKVFGWQAEYNKQAA